MNSLAIKAALIRAGISQRAIAAEAAVSPSLVSAVIQGRRTSGTEAKRVRWTIALALDKPVGKVFP